MQSAADVFHASMAKLFENPSALESDDIYITAFPEILKNVMLQCFEIENNRRRALHMPPMDKNVCFARYDARSSAPLPFSDYMAAVVFPLYIASEFMRDAGQYDMSAYFREQFVSALQEQDVCCPEEVDCIL